MPPRKSTLGKRKNIPMPIPVQLPVPVSVKKHRLGSSSVKIKCPQRLNCVVARRQLWSSREELLNRSQKNKEQHFGAQTEEREPADGERNILRTAKGKENFGSRFELNSFTRETKGNVAAQCSQHITAEVPIFPNKIRTPGFANRPSIPEAPVLLKSNKSQRLACFTSQFSTQPCDLGKVFPLSDFAGTTIDVPEFLISSTSQRLAGFTTDSSELGKTFPALDSEKIGNSEVPVLLKSNRSRRLAGFTSHFSTESSEPGETFLASESTGDVPNLLKSNRSQTLVGLTSHVPTEFNGFCKSLTPGLVVAGTIAESNFLKSKRQRYSAYQNTKESGQHEKVTSHCGETDNLNAPVISRSNNSQKILGITSQNEMESYGSEKAVVSNYGELETKGGTTDKLVSSKEHDNISASYTDRISTECFWPRTSQPAHGSNPGAAIVRSERKKFSDNPRDRYSCTYLKSTLEKGSKRAKVGEHESHAKSSLPCNKTASRLSEKSSLMTCNDEVYTDNLSYPSAPRASLEKKPLSISANKTNSLQNNGTENSTTQNISLLEFEKNELCNTAYESLQTEPCCSKSDPTFRASKGGTLTVSVATQTDLFETSKTVETSNLICIKAAIEKLFSQIKKQEENIQKQSDDIHNEMVNIISMFNKQTDKANNDSMFGEINNCLSDIRQENFKNSETSSVHLVSRLPVRRSARIAAQTSLTVSANNTFSESTVVPATPTQLESDEEIDHLGAKSVKVVRFNKSVNLYKDLRSSFHFLKTPQNRKQSLAKTPKNTPTRMLSRRIQDQLLSLYD